VTDNNIRYNGKTSVSVLLVSRESFFLNLVSSERLFHIFAPRYVKDFFTIFSVEPWNKKVMDRAS